MGMDDEDSGKKDVNEQNGDDKTQIVQMKELRNWTPYTADRDILCCDFSPYDDTVACASEDSKVHILTLPKQCIMRSNKFSADFREEKGKNHKNVEQNSNAHGRQFSN